jgi:hypothetical protein
MQIKYTLQYSVIFVKCLGVSQDQIQKVAKTVTV